MPLNPVSCPFPPPCSLAMLSVIGFVAQHAANDKSPLAVLGEHISNPWGDNFATNGG